MNEIMDHGAPIHWDDIAGQSGFHLDVTFDDFFYLLEFYPYLFSLFIHNRKLFLGLTMNCIPKKLLYFVYE